jgi:cryptochrome
LECQSDLSKSYTKINPKQRLWLVREAPQTVLPKLWKKWGITHLVFEKDTDPYARERDEAVIRLAEQAGVEVVVRMGRTLFDPDELVSKNGGKPTMSMTQTEKAAEKINRGQPDRPVETPKNVPDPWGKNTRLQIRRQT